MKTKDKRQKRNKIDNLKVLSSRCRAVPSDIATLAGVDLNFAKRGLVYLATLVDGDLEVSKDGKPKRGRWKRELVFALFLFCLFFVSFLFSTVVIVAVHDDVKKVAAAAT